MVNYSFDTQYTADETGQVYFNRLSKFRPDIKIGDKVSSFINKYGYREYILTDSTGHKKHIQAHRIVASLFIPNINNKRYVNHIDGNKLNNNISNLEWCTASENENHSYQILKKQVWNKDKQLPSGKHYKGKIRTVQSFTLDGTTVKTYFNPTEAEQDGFNLKQISAVCCGTQKTHKGLLWKYV
ncbi:MAG: HNH endonuclease [Bacteroidia bacterium]|nr:HNH endonuclease [Bacteroidia bacterium]